MSVFLLYLDIGVGLGGKERCQKVYYVVNACEADPALHSSQFGEGRHEEERRGGKGTECSTLLGADRNAQPISETRRVRRRKGGRRGGLCAAPRALSCHLFSEARREKASGGEQGQAAVALFPLPCEQVGRTLRLLADEDPATTAAAPREPAVGSSGCEARGHGGTTTTTTTATAARRSRHERTAEDSNGTAKRSVGKKGRKTNRRKKRRKAPHGLEHHQAPHRNATPRCATATASAHRATVSHDL